ncbi:MAG: hypothetical protein ABIZ72_08760, partial [Candidatus Limnocylindrales bacterium]
MTPTDILDDPAAVQSAAEPARESRPGELVPGGPAIGHAPRSISAPVARRYLALHHFLAPARSLPSGPAGIL